MRKPAVPILLSLVLCGFSSASAFEATVVPQRIYPGDAFIVRVNGVHSPDRPSAVLEGKELHFSPCGEGCFIAFGAVKVDTAEGEYPLHLASGRERSVQRIIVSRYDFPSISLSLPEEKVFLSPEDQQRADREAKRLREIWGTASVRLWDGGFIMPLDSKVTTAFGTRRIMNRKKTSIHQGVDLKGKAGEQVRAFNRGVVVLADELFFGGNTVILDHGQGIFSVYMHLDGFRAAEGDILSKGDVVGIVGSSGRATGPHLHFGVKVADVSVNPLSFMKLSFPSP